MSTNPEEAPDSSAPNIAALPPPSVEATLREELAQANATLATITTERNTLASKHKTQEAIIRDLKEQVRAFQKNDLSFVLNNLDAGSLLSDAGAKLHELVEVVERRGGKGTFALHIAVKKHSEGTFTFTPELKVTPPKEEPAKSVFYLNDGRLTRQDPKQRRFNFENEDAAEAYEREHPELS